MGSILILYLHGFRSSPQSTKARQLKQHMEAAGLGARFCCPQLPVSPFEAIELAAGIIRSASGQVTLVGSSLGGYYATWLTEHHGDRIHRTVLVNPFVMAPLLPEKFAGTHSNYHSGEAFEFTPRHVAEVKALDLPLPGAQERYWLLLERGDEVLDYRLAVAKYPAAQQTVLEGGDHGFTRWGDYLDDICRC